jgi:RHS repeat-associated protein
MTPLAAPRRICNCRVSASFLLVAVLSAAAVRAQVPFADTQRGFPPNTGIATTGLDHVNLFNGNVAVSIPLGPGYPVGAGLSSQLRLVYNSHIWRTGFACVNPIDGRDYYGVYVRGSSVFGAGWRLDLGYLHQELNDDFALGPDFLTPDGSAHRFGSAVPSVTRDTSFLRRQATNEVDFPNGDRGFLNQVIPSSAVAHGSTTLDFDADGSFLTKLQSRFDDYVLVNYVSNYEVFDNTIRIASVQHFHRNHSTGQDELLRTINFHYTSLTVNAGTINTWAVVSEIDFPTTAGTQRVLFTYHTSGFDRPVTDITASACPSGPQSRSTVAAPLLKSIQLDASQPALSYQFEYLTTFDTSLGAKAGVIRQMIVPTGGAVQYVWSIPPGSPASLAPDSSCQRGDPTCDFAFRRRNIAGILQRIEYPDGLGGQGNTWAYNRERFGFTPPIYKRTEVIAPDGFKAWHYFNDEPDSTAYRESNGLEYQMEHLDENDVVTRRTRFCYSDDSGIRNNLCGLDNTFRSLAGNIRQSLTDVTTMNSGGGPVQTKRIQRGAWDGYGHFGTEDFYDWDNATRRRSVATTWIANSSAWILDLFNQRARSDSGSSPNCLDGSTVCDYLEVLTSTGFLRGKVTWDKPKTRILADCRYPDADGNVSQEFTATAEPFSDPPPIDICSAAYPEFPNVNIGLNSDAFGNTYVYLNGQLTRTKRMINNAPQEDWYSVDHTRAPSTGWITTTRDTAGVPTSYAYDVLGRVTQVSYPPPNGEAALTVTYDSPTQTTLTRNGGSGLATWERQIYDGFGRLTREARQLASGSPSSYAVRVHRYDEVGRKSFDSEWAGCADAGSCAAATVTQGTTYAGFDPFGRPQTVIAADGATTSVSYADGSVPFSDTQKIVTVNNLNGTCGVGSCSGGSSASTTYRYDVFGRLISVREPNGVDVTTYSYDVNDKLTTVTQGGQSRTFSHDAFGFLRGESTPEKGSVTYDRYGSLGNLRQKTEGGGNILSYIYDAAGRMTCQFAGAVPLGATCAAPGAGAVAYVRNCYDGAGCPGGSFPGGKLTQRIGYNPFSPGQSAVTENFTYSGLGGRLSIKTTTISATPLPVNPVTETWSYNLLGMLSAHSLPRRSIDSDVFASWQFSNGWPIGITVGGQTLVSLVTYHPHGGLRSWKAGNNVTTTIAEDPALLARPASLSASSGGFNTGAYAYDGAGNIKSVGSDSFTYDDRSRLFSSTVSGVVLSYPYDRYGNLNYTQVNQKTNRLKAGAYDERGNLIVYGSQRFEYDALSRQASVNGGYERYLYDGAGERIARITASSPGMKLFTISPCRVIDTRFSPPMVAPTPRLVQVAGNCGVAAGASGLVGNLTAVPGAGSGFLNIYPTGTNPSTSTLNFNAGVVRANNFSLALSGGGQVSLAASTPVDAIVDVVGYFAFDNPTWTVTFRDESNRLASDYTISGSVARAKNYFYFGNLLVATRDSGGNYIYYSSDHLGTPRQVTNSSGQVIETHKYQPFGQEIGGSFGNQPLKFASMERDVSSGNDFDHARYQSSLQGRFLSPEPVFLGAAVNPQTWNTYSYANNNPLKFVDPDGNVAIIFLTGAFGGAYVGGADLRALDRENPGAPFSLRLAKYSIGFAAGFVGTLAGEMEALGGSPALAGAVGSGVASFVDQGLNNLFFGENISVAQLGIDVAAGATVSKVAYRIGVHPGRDPLLSKFRPLSDYVLRPKVAGRAGRSLMEGALGFGIGGATRLPSERSPSGVPYISPNYYNFEQFLFQYRTEVAAAAGIPGGSVIEDRII